MSAIIGIMDKFWKICAVKDAKLHATQTEPEGITRVCDIPYLSDGDRYHLLDVYYPESVGTDEKLPIIIDVHGGGWMYADKELNKMYCLNLAKRGFTVFNISYRLVPDVNVNEQLRDVACALRFIGSVLGDYPCDASHIMLTGDSAGGMLAVFSAALLGSEKLREVFGVCDGGLKLSCLLLTSPVSYMNNGGVMSVYTKTMWGKTSDALSTADYMNLDSLLKLSTLPPTCLITSSGDILALKQTRKAAGEIAMAGVKVKLMDYPKFKGKNLPHVFSVLEPESEAGKDAIDGAVDFYLSVINAEVN